MNMRKLARRLAPVVVGLFLLYTGAGVLALELHNLSTTDGSNTGTAANAGWPENMPPSDVNNAARALSGMIAREASDRSGDLKATGTANAIVVAAYRTLTAYFDGMRIAFQATGTNTAAVTLNVDSLGVKSVNKGENTALAAGDIVDHAYVEVAYDASTDAFILLTPPGANNPITSQGDLIVGNSAGGPARLATGPYNSVLTSGKSTVAWSATASVIGRQTIFIPAGAMSAAVVSPAETGLTYATGANKPDIPFIGFSGVDSTGDEFTFFSVAFPKGWDAGTVKFQVFWSAGLATTNTVVWGLQGVSLSDSTTFDTAYGAAVNVTDTGLNTADDVHISLESSPVTIANTPSTGDLVYFRLFRDTSADSMESTDARFLGLKLFYNVDAANDN